jgi:hypothetical protein
MQGQYPNRAPDIHGLLDVLGRHGVRYVLTGSVAALAYGVDIGQPGDLDITPALDTENLSRLEAVLREIEAGLDPDTSFGHWETQPDGEQKWKADAPSPELLARRANWRPDPADVSTFDHLFRSRLGNFDVVPEVSGTYETLMKRAVLMQVLGHDVRVVHVDELLAALTVPRRAKDGPRVRQLRDVQRQRGERAPSRAGGARDA